MAQGLTRTRVFEIADRDGWSLRHLARAMGVSPEYVSAIKRGDRQIGAAFIRGARRAFPDYPLDFLFPADVPPTKVEVPA